MSPFGRKDSGVLLNLCIHYIREHNLNRKIGVFHMDYEAQYQMTTEYVEETFRRIRIYWKSTMSVFLSKS